MLHCKGNEPVIAISCDPLRERRRCQLSETAFFTEKNGVSRDRDLGTMSRKHLRCACLTSFGATFQIIPVEQGGHDTANLDHMPASLRPLCSSPYLLILLICICTTTMHEILNAALG